MIRCVERVLKVSSRARARKSEDSYKRMRDCGAPKAPSSRYFRSPSCISLIVRLAEAGGPGEIR